MRIIGSSRFCARPFLRLFVIFGLFADNLA
jgi:hypothetical protein